MGKPAGGSTGTRNGCSGISGSGIEAGAGAFSAWTGNREGPAFGSTSRGIGAAMTGSLPCVDARACTRWCCAGITASGGGAAIDPEDPDEVTETGRCIGGATGRAGAFGFSFP